MVIKPGAAPITWEVGPDKREITCVGKSLDPVAVAAIETNILAKRFLKRLQ